MQVVPLPQNRNQQPTFVGVPVHPQSQQQQSIPTYTEGYNTNLKVIDSNLIPCTTIISDLQSIQPVFDLTAIGLQNIQIPDEVIFERRAPWFGSTWSEKSIFKIAGLGTLWMGDEYKRHLGFLWRLIPRQTKRRRQFSDFRGLFNSHFFILPDYIIENEHIEMEYWNSLSIILNNLTQYL